MCEKIGAGAGAATNSTPGPAPTQSPHTVHAFTSLRFPHAHLRVMIRSPREAQSYILNDIYCITVTFDNGYMI